jgi:cell division protein FtsL
MMNQRMMSWLIGMGLFAVAAFGLYLVKYTVQDMQREVAQLEAELKNEQESLHLLQAEWAYLNRPERLRVMAEKHLELAPFDTRKMMPIEALPARLEEENVPSVSERPKLFQPVGGY